MRWLILAIIGIGAAGWITVILMGQKPSPAPAPAAEAASEFTSVESVQNTQSMKPDAPHPLKHRQAAAGESETRAAAASQASAGDSISFNHAVETLVSPHTSYGQKQAAFSELRKAGKLDDAIKELEQRAAREPSVPEYPAALGQAYLQKAGTIQDMREQGILAMNADKCFDAALNMDANNWEARFTKAVAMSYWPTQMNKGPEIVEHFRTLVAQQEAKAPQPHFALTYAWFGDEYQKYGNSAAAKQVWQRGAALFPSNKGLQERITAPDVPPSQRRPGWMNEQ